MQTITICYASHILTGPNMQTLVKFYMVYAKIKNLEILAMFVFILFMYTNVEISTTALLKTTR